jgi:hypothetical protein
VVWEQCPTTLIEQVLETWVKDINHPLAQQLALQTKTHLAKIFNMEEDRLLAQSVAEQSQMQPIVAMASEIQPASVPQDWYHGQWVPKLATRKVPDFKPAIQNLLPTALVQRRLNAEPFRFVLNKWQLQSPNEDLKILTGRLGITMNTGTWWDDVLKFMLIGGAATIAFTGVKLFSSVSSIASRSAPANIPASPVVKQPEDFTPIGIVVNSKDRINDDSPLSGTKVIASFSKGVHDGDVLGIRADKSQNLIQSNDGRLKIQDADIAQVEGGTQNQPLQITFNEKATWEQVNNTLGQISYMNTTQQPADGIREIEFKVVDSEGTSSDPRTYQVYATSPNQKPTVSIESKETLNVRGGDDIKIGAISIDDTEKSDVEVILKAAHGRLKLAKPNFPKEVKAPEITGQDSESLQITGSLNAVQILLAQKSGLIYKGNSDYSGSETIQITVRDKGKPKKEKDGKRIITWKDDYLKPEEESTSIGIQVADRNKPPAMTTLPKGLKVKAGESVSFGGISIQDADTDKIKLTLSVDMGTLTLNHSMKDKSIVGNKTQSITIEGTLSAINKALADPSSVTYKHTQGGNPTLRIKVDDGGKGREESVPIKVERKNTKPMWQSITELPPASESPISSNSKSSGSQSSSPGLSADEATAVIQRFLGLKGQIYGKESNTDLVFRYTTGKYQEGVLQIISEAQAEGEYSLYANQSVRAISPTSGNANEVTIEVAISEEITTVGGKRSGEVDKRDGNSSFTLVKDGEIWKIASRKKL